MSFDILTQAVDETGVCLLKTIDDKPMLNADGERCAIVMHGPGSLVYQQAMSRRQHRLMLAVTSARADKDGKEAAFDAVAETAARLRNDAELMADITVAFQGFDVGGQTGREAFLALYGNPALGYITKQADDFASRWGNFLPARRAS